MENNVIDSKIRAVQADVRVWLKENWHVNHSLLEWRNLLVESGWGVPCWPKAWYGRGLPADMETAVNGEFAAAGALGVARAGIRMLAAATLLEHGTEAHKQKFLRRILTGEDNWCQLFSEPGSGSDLAGATTRADLKDGRWLINGQKLWTTSAHHAEWGLLLARTDWDLPKHQGLSYFVLDMRQPGVEVQPLRQMNGHASFNQVFFDNAVIEPEYLVGALGDGWKVAMTTLAHERRSADGFRNWGKVSNGEGAIFEEERAENAIFNEPYKWYPQRAGRVDLIMQRARDSGLISDLRVRQEIAALLILSETAKWTAQRARAAQQLGRPQGPEGSLGKLAGSHIARAASRVHTLLGGAEVMLKGKDSEMQGLIAEILLSVPATSIAGGTDEIQRNIIAERVLGMPKEPRFDTGPFRDVPRGLKK